MATGPQKEPWPWRSVVICQYAAVVTLLVLSVLLAKFFGGSFQIVISWIGLPLLALSGLGVMAWAIWKPRWRKTGAAALAVVIGLGLVLATPWISAGGNWLFLQSRRAELETFTRDVLAYGRINQMSDGLRYFKEFNGELVAYSDASTQERTEPGLRQVLPLKDVLVRDGIERARYEEFRTRLHHLRLIQFEVRPGYVAFLYDGFLDNLNGFLQVRDGNPPPELGTELFLCELVVLEALGGGWYWFATT